MYKMPFYMPQKHTSLIGLDQNLFPKMVTNLK